MHPSRKWIPGVERARTVPVLLATLLFVACETLPSVVDSDDGARIDGISLTTSDTRVSPGDPLGLTLHNHSGAPLGYNLCFVEFQPRVNGEWSEQTVQFLRMCQEDLPILADGRSASSQEIVPAMQHGTYRVRTTVATGGKRVTIASAPFVVSP